MTLHKMKAQVTSFGVNTVGYEYGLFNTIIYINVPWNYYLLPFLYHGPATVLFLHGYNGPTEPHIQIFSIPNMRDIRSNLKHPPLRLASHAQRSSTCTMINANRKPYKDQADRPIQRRRVCAGTTKPPYSASQYCVNLTVNTRSAETKRGFLLWLSAGRCSVGA